jgi:DNA-binding transcriptional ArsR family regulator
MVSARRLDDPEVLKAFAQPFRQRLYRLLAQVGPATVGMLAKQLGGADPGLVSYHLRELARRGFVEDAPELARDRRERWWRLVPGATSWSWRDFTTPEGRAIASAAKSQMVIDEFERLRRYEQTRETWDESWRGAAVSSDSFLYLSPAELGELDAELHQVLGRWAEHSRRARAAEHPAAGESVAGESVAQASGRAPVFLFFHAFPDRPR